MIFTKVFGIGINKTGTTTLGHCLNILGYKHYSFDFELLSEVHNFNWSRINQIIQTYDSFEDWPYPLIYSQLDFLYPRSKFILTRRRTPEMWLQSLSAHSLRTDPIMGTKTRLMAYGWEYPQMNPKAHIAHYNSHLTGVRQYFNGREEDFLEVCWEEGDGWNKLCNFLNQEVPIGIPFPHLNKSQDVATVNHAMNEKRLRMLLDDKNLYR